MAFPAVASQRHTPSVPPLAEASEEDHRGAITERGGPMALAEAIKDILECDIPAAFERFGKVLDPQWIDIPLCQCGVRHGRVEMYIARAES